MIASEFANAIGDDILALEWVQRYGGLTCTIENKEGVMVPVAENVSPEECYDVKHYKTMIPHSDVKGLVYLEEASNITGDYGDYGMVDFDQKLRVLCWLNYPKNGFTHTVFTPFETVLRIILATRINTNGISIKTISGLNIFSKEAARKMFQKYKYKVDDTALLNWPYGVFVAEFNMAGFANPECLEVNAGGPDIGCT